MVSLTPGIFWELSRGKLTIRFWADAKAAVWDEGPMQMEGSISIDKFFFIPVHGSGNDLNLVGLIYPETGKGSWSIFDYHSGYATNLAESTERGQVLSVPVKVPYPGHYRLYAAIFSAPDNELVITFHNKADRQEAKVKVKGSDAWSVIALDPVYLEQGEYDIVLKHLGKDNILLDYLILLPFTPVSDIIE